PRSSSCILPFCDCLPPVTICMDRYSPKDPRGRNIRSEAPMRTTLARRLGSMERRFGVGVAIKEIPHPLDVISPEDRELVLKGRQARATGKPLDTPEVHAAIRRYLIAAANYVEMRRKAGFQFRPTAETIRERRFRQRQGAAEAVL